MEQNRLCISDILDEVRCNPIFVFWADIGPISDINIGLGQSWKEQMPSLDGFHLFCCLLLLVCVMVLQSFPPPNVFFHTPAAAV